MTTTRNAHQRYRDRKIAQTTGTVTDWWWWCTLARYEGRCAYCEQVIPTHLIVQEHVIPLCQGGLHDRTNVVPACRHCNNSKGGRTPEEAGLTLHRK